MALFEELIAASAETVKAKRIEVSVLEWEPILKGKKLYLQVMGLEDRDAWEAEGLERKGDDYEANLKNLRARLLCRCLVDEEGNRVFPNTASIAKLPSTVATPLYEQAHQLNTVTKKDLEDLAKN